MTVYRKGDMVLVPGVVKYDQDVGDIGFVWVDVGYQVHKAEAGDVRMLQPRFDIGETVEYQSGDELYSGEVIAVNGGMIWVRGEFGDEVIEASTATIKPKPIDVIEGIPAAEPAPETTAPSAALAMDF